MKNIDLSSNRPVATTSEAYRAMFGIPSAKDSILEIPIERLIPYENQPFKPYSEDKLRELAENIAENGIHEPVIVRPYVGKYQILSGHNRTNAAKLAGLSSVRCIIREDCDDDAAALLVVDSNLNQRDELLPSEKAFAYKMQLDVKKRRAGRPTGNCAQIAHNFQGIKSRDLLAEQLGESKDKIQRFIRLTYLIKPLLDMVDEKRLPLIPAVNISYLRDSEQTILCEYINMKNITVSVEQSKLLKMLSLDDGIGYNTMDNVFSKVPLNNTKKPLKKKVFKLKAQNFAEWITPEMSDEEFEEFLIDAVKYSTTHQRKDLRVIAKGDQHAQFG